MTDLTAVHGKPFAIILLERDGARYVISGTARVAKGSLLVDRGDGKPPFPVPDDTLYRIKAVDPAAAGILNGAAWCITLRVDPLPKGTDTADLVGTGVQLPVKRRMGNQRAARTTTPRPPAAPRPTKLPRPAKQPRPAAKRSVRRKRPPTA